MGRNHLAVVALLLLSLSGIGNARPLRIADVLGSTEGVAEALFLPGDERVIFAELVPYDKAGQYSVATHFGQLGKERSRVMSLDVASGEISALAESESDTGAWMGPVSPNGSRLVINTISGLDVRAKILSLVTGEETALDVRPDTLLGEQSPIWTSDRTLVIAELPEGRPSYAMAGVRYSAEYLPQLWRNAWDGQVPTASELTSGAARSSEPGIMGRLVEVDIETGLKTALGRGDFVALVPSPDGSAIAALSRQNAPARAEGVPVDYFSGSGRLQLRIFRRGAGWSEWTLDRRYDVAPYSVQWSSDGGSVLFVARRSADLWRREARAYRLALGSFELREAGSDRVRIGYDMDPIREPLQAVWVGTDIVLSARERSVAETSSVADGDGGKALYVVRGDGFLEQLPLPSGAGAFSIAAASDDSVFVSVGDAIWKVPVRARAAPTSLTADIEGGVRQVWETAGYNLKQWTRVPRTRYLAVETLGAERPMLIVIDVLSERRTMIPRPSSRSRVVALSNDGSRAVLAGEPPHGDLYLSSAGGDSRHVLSFNEHLRDVRRSVLRRVSFVGGQGEPLHAWLVLPPDHQPGRRYPLIVHVYADSYMGESEDFSLPLYGRYFNPYLYAEFGYASLFPSMPLEPMGKPSDPGIGLSGTVLAAIDAAVSDGSVDPSRLALYGHSFGMFSALAILVETDRFSAAAVGSGFSDLASEFGEFMPNLRLFAAENLEHAMMQQGWTEGGQGRMGSPPWEDPQRYVRNSGYFNADRIDTPLLLFHGDLDFISMSHSEKMFSALFRQGRDAKFIRYWGEGHNVSSPANISDLWRRLLAWYDLYLDVHRDENGALIFSEETASSRGSREPLEPEDFSRFDR